MGKLYYQTENGKALSKENHKRTPKRKEARTAVDPGYGKGLLSMGAARSARYWERKAAEVRFLKLWNVYF